MPDNEEQKIEVSTTKINTGTVGPSFKYPAPVKMKRVIKALNYFCVGLITMVSGSDLFTLKQSKWIAFFLGVFILMIGALEVATGVKPLDEDDKPSYKSNIGKTLIFILVWLLISHF